MTQPVRQVITASHKSREIALHYATSFHCTPSDNILSDQNITKADTTSPTMRDVSNGPNVC